MQTRRSLVAMELQKLRRFRAKVAPDIALREDVDALYKSFTKKQTAMGTLEDMWKEIAPPEFASRASIKKLSKAGILTIAAKDSAAAYEFDQWLRGGGLVMIKKRSKVTIKSVRVEQ